MCIRFGAPRGGGHGQPSYPGATRRGVGGDDGPAASGGGHKGRGRVGGREDPTRGPMCCRSAPGASWPSIRHNIPRGLLGANIFPIQLCRDTHALFIVCRTTCSYTASVPTAADVGSGRFKGLVLKKP